MTVQDYKQSIKNIIDSTNNEDLLKHWKKQLEHDVEHKDEIELAAEEWNLVEEALADYKNGDVVSMEDFIRSRK